MKLQYEKQTIKVYQMKRQKLPSGMQLVSVPAFKRMKNLLRV